SACRRHGRRCAAASRPPAAWPGSGRRARAGSVRLATAWSCPEGFSARLAAATATAQAGRMRDRPPTSTALAGCYVISLRPVGGHAPVRRAAAAHGARTLALSPWKLARREDRATRDALRAALAADRVLATSPAAVRAAAALRPLRRRRGQHWFAVGAGTAGALRRAGVDEVAAPARMDSEG